ncbi:MAG: phytanoyl-CoA dioxygenase family protein [Candidatus Latescibacterota bacterium]|nr:phytanoyl-CoA dioxygenase family protein [Candidatus Latescibacterota bacterium]
MSAEEQMDLPFPALTPAQRLHLDVFGYVVIEDTLTTQECGVLIEALQRLKHDLIEAGRPSSRTDEEETKVRGAGLADSRPAHHDFMRDIEQADPAITAYITHPRMVGMAAEIIGGEVRMVESNAHINSRAPDWEAVDADAHRFPFHRGTDVPFGSHSRHGLYHCNFVKTLTNLTDLGPDDGGTVVIAGSHKMDLPSEQLIECAYQDRSLIHQVVAPAGSTLLFVEPLIHATGRLICERERVIIITGYGPAQFPYWGDGELTEEFKAQIPPNQHLLFHGRQNWNRRTLERQDLMTPADSRRFELGEWNKRD